MQENSHVIFFSAEPIHGYRDLLRSHPGQERDLIDALLRTVIHLDGDGEIRADEVRPSLEDERARELTDAAAREIANHRPEDRLDLLGEITFRSDRREPGPWLSPVMAAQMSALAGNAPSIRCAGDLTLRVALVAALRPSQPAVLYVTRNTRLAELAVLLGRAVGVELDVETDPSRNDQEHESEIVIPRFGERTGSDALDPTLRERIGGRAVASETIALAEALVRQRRRCILCVTNGVLFRGVGIEPKLREELIESGRLRAVLALPGQVIPDTGIASSLLVLEPKGHMRRVSVRFLDLGHDRYAARTLRGRPELRPEPLWWDGIEGPLPDAKGAALDVPRAEILAQDASLAIERYKGASVSEVVSAFVERHGGHTAADVFEFIRPGALKADKEGDLKVFEAVPGDFGPRGYVMAPSKRFRVGRGDDGKARKQQLLPGDLLLAAKGTVGPVALVPPDAPPERAGVIWTAGQSIMILRPRRTFRPLTVALYEYLRSDAVQRHLDAIAGGTAIRHISARDLKILPIALPPPEVQDEVEAAFVERQKAFDEIDRITSEIEFRRHRTWPHLDLGPDREA